MHRGSEDVNSGEGEGEVQPFEGKGRKRDEQVMKTTQRKDDTGDDGKEDKRSKEKSGKEEVEDGLQHVKNGKKRHTDKSS